MVETAAVFFHCPGVLGCVVQGAAVETEYPGRIVLVHLVAQARCFPVFQHPHPGKRAVVPDAYCQFHHAVVAPGTDGAEYQAHGLCAEPGAEHVGRRLRSEIGRQVDTDPVRGQVVIVFQGQDLCADLQDRQVAVACDGVLEVIPEGINSQHRSEANEQQRQGIQQHVFLFCHYCSPNTLGRVSRSINGTKTLASSTANATPSGYAPHPRSRQTSAPIRTP